MTPLRIVHVALQLHTGGMERLLLEFARHADRARFALRFVSIGTRGRMAEEIEALGWPVTALDVKSGLRPAAIFRLANLFRDQSDVVHTHNSKPLLYAGSAARLAQVNAVVHTRHGQRFGASKRQDALFRLAAKCADRIVCVSEDSARLCQRDGVDAASIRRIWNGVDLSRFSARGPAAGGPAVYAGRLSAEKDIPTLLQAAAIAVAKCPAFRLRIAGTGPCGDHLACLAESLGLRSHVEFIGETRDVPALLAASSLFVLPSLTEGLPLTVLEAMACGLPVVATRVGGTPEAVVDGRTGVLLPPREPEQLAGAMLRIFDDPALSIDMGRAGRERAEHWFDARRMVSQYESLYTEVAAGARRQAA